MLEAFFEVPQYSLPQAEKQARLVQALNALTLRHRELCPDYARMLRAFAGDTTRFERLEDFPYLPVSLFKTNYLKSVPDEDVRIVMTSSGTTGQAVSRIAVDAETARLQSKALASVVTSVLGQQRLPMLVIDSAATVRDPRALSARGAGVLGLMQFGRKHAFLLDADGGIDHDAVAAFLAENDGKPFFMFGFTFMVWQHLRPALQERRYDLSQGVLFHSGGWKKLTELAVDNATFKSELRTLSGLQRVHNFYGMVEQIGSIFLEGSDGYLYPPNFADVIIRRPGGLEPAEPGEVGVIEVVSALPRSYPGHVLLTEDLGVIRTVDAGVGGRLGKALEILGRVPKAELRGCSDVIAAGSKAAA